MNRLMTDAEAHHILQEDIDSIIVGHYRNVDKFYNYEEDLRSPSIESIIKDAAGTVMFWY